MDAARLAQAVGVHIDRARLWAPHVAACVLHADLDSRERLAAFLAQAGHESSGFRHVREIWGPTPAQTRYEGRRDLGNTQPGDGKRYMGRGLIQITGRHNYARLTDRLRDECCPDFVEHPKLLESPKWAALSAADYWKDRHLNRFCTPGNMEFRALTRAINGGFNGLNDRLARYGRAFAALEGA